jgi:hypothetical protein
MNTRCGQNFRRNIVTVSNFHYGTIHKKEERMFDIINDGEGGRSLYGSMWRDEE